jgi:hypothetical protein
MPPITATPTPSFSSHHDISPVAKAVVAIATIIWTFIIILAILCSVRCYRKRQARKEEEREQPDPDSKWWQRTDLPQPIAELPGNETYLAQVAELQGRQIASSSNPPNRDKDLPLHPAHANTDPMSQVSGVQGQQHLSRNTPTIRPSNKATNALPASNISQASRSQRQHLSPSTPASRAPDTPPKAPPARIISHVSNFQGQQISPNSPTPPKPPPTITLTRASLIGPLTHPNNTPKTTESQPQTPDQSTPTYDTDRSHPSTPSSPASSTKLHTTTSNKTELDKLREKQARISERRQRLLEIHVLDEEDEDIKRKIAALQSGSGG